MAAKQTMGETPQGGGSNQPKRRNFLDRLKGKNKVEKIHEDTQKKVESLRKDELGHLTPGSQGYAEALQKRWLTSGSLSQSDLNQVKEYLRANFGGDGVEAVKKFQQKHYKKHPSILDTNPLDTRRATALGVIGPSIANLVPMLKDGSDKYLSEAEIKDAISKQKKYASSAQIAQLKEFFGGGSDMGEKGLATAIFSYQVRNGLAAKDGFANPNYRGGTWDHMFDKVGRPASTPTPPRETTPPTSTPETTPPAPTSVGTETPPEVPVEPVAPEVIPSEGQEYTVQPRDTLGGIANKYPGVSVEDIMKANGIEDPNKIRVDQKLKIPTPSEAPEEGVESNEVTELNKEVDAYIDGITVEKLLAGEDITTKLGELQKKIMEVGEVEGIQEVGAKLAPYSYFLKWYDKINKTSDPQEQLDLLKDIKEHEHYAYIKGTKIDTYIDKKVEALADDGADVSGFEGILESEEADEKAKEALAKKVELIQDLDVDGTSVLEKLGRGDILADDADSEDVNEREKDLEDAIKLIEAISGRSVEFKMEDGVPTEIRKDNVIEGAIKDAFEDATGEELHDQIQAAGFEKEDGDEKVADVEAFLDAIGSTSVEMDEQALTDLLEFYGEDAAKNGLSVKKEFFEAKEEEQKASQELDKKVDLIQGLGVLEKLGRGDILADDADSEDVNEREKDLEDAIKLIEKISGETVEFEMEDGVPTEIKGDGVIKGAITDAFENARGEALHDQIKAAGFEKEDGDEKVADVEAFLSEIGSISTEVDDTALTDLLKFYGEDAAKIGLKIDKGHFEDVESERKEAETLKKQIELIQGLGVLNTLGRGDILADDPDSEDVNEQKDDLTAAIKLIEKISGEKVEFEMEDGVPTEIKGDGVIKGAITDAFENARGEALHDQIKAAGFEKEDGDEKVADVEAFLSEIGSISTEVDDTALTDLLKFYGEDAAKNGLTVKKEFFEAKEAEEKASEALDKKAELVEDLGVLRILGRGGIEGDDADSEDVNEREKDLEDAIKLIESISGRKVEFKMEDGVATEIEKDNVIKGAITDAFEDARESVAEEVAEMDRYQNEDGEVNLVAFLKDIKAVPDDTPDGSITELTDEHLTALLAFYQSNNQPPRLSITGAAPEAEEEDEGPSEEDVSGDIDSLGLD